MHPNVSKSKKKPKGCLGDVHRFISATIIWVWKTWKFTRQGVSNERCPWFALCGIRCFFTTWTIKVTKTSLNLLLTLKISALPLPFSPKARAGGTVIFRFSPAHMSFIPMSRPLMICPTPCTNHWGWPSLSDRLKQKQKQTINHNSYQYWTVRLSSLEGGRWGIVTFTLASWDNCALFAIFSNRPTS